MDLANALAQLSELTPAGGDSERATRQALEALPSCLDTKISAKNSLKSMPITESIIST